VEPWRRLSENGGILSWGATSQGIGEENGQGSATSHRPDGQIKAKREETERKDVKRMEGKDEGARSGKKKINGSLYVVKNQPTLRVRAEREDIRSRSLNGGHRHPEFKSRKNKKGKVDQDRVLYRKRQDVIVKYSPHETKVL